MLYRAEGSAQPGWPACTASPHDLPLRVSLTAFPLPSHCLPRRPPGPIPIPVVGRVTSPWALAEQDGVPPTQPSQSQATQPPPAAEGGGRPSTGGQSLPRPGGRRSLLGVSNVRRASGGGAAGAGATPASAVRANPAGAEGKLPTPWSTLRPWDTKAAAAAAAATQDENQAGPPQQQPEAQQQEERPASAGAGGGGDAAGPRRATRHAAAAAEPPAAGDASGGAAGPSHGCIALTSVDGAVVDLARSATRRLRGLRICPEGKEDGQVRWRGAGVGMGPYV